MDENKTMSSGGVVDCFENGCYLDILAELYSCVRLPLSAFICTIGCFFNVCNVIIFSRPKMRTPVNVFLASLSLAQFLFTLNYLILTLLEYFRALCYPFAWTYAFTIYKLITVNVSLVLHSIALGHILAVVAFRIRSMQPPIQLNQFLYGTDWAVSASGMVWLFVPMFCIPVYFSSVMIPSLRNHCQFEQVFEHQNVNDQFLIATVYWMYGVVLKLLPAMFALFLFCALLKLPLSSEEFRRRMRESQDKQRKISSTSSRRSTTTLATNDHPTGTLATLLIIIVLIELLHGFWNLWNGVYHNLDFQLLVRGQPSRLVELWMLLQHAFSFLIYWHTLAQFRQTLHSFFMCRRDREFEESMSLSKKRCADSVMLAKEKQKRKFTGSEQPEEEVLTAKSSVANRPHGPYPTIIISNDKTRNITKLTF